MTAKIEHRQVLEPISIGDQGVDHAWTRLGAAEIELFELWHQRRFEEPGPEGVSPSAEAQPLEARRRLGEQIQQRRAARHGRRGDDELLERRQVDVMRGPRIQGLVRALVRECVAVGRAEGAKLDDALADKLAQQLAQSPRAETRSDVLRPNGRIRHGGDARNGVIVRLGARMASQRL